jgi:GNAT superfamily N-acetyltransferase
VAPRAADCHPAGVDHQLPLLHGLGSGWASDLEVLARTGSVVEDRGDHLVARTPANPGYHWGNCLVVRDPGLVDEADEWVAAFDEAFPEAKHVAIGLPGPPTRGRWAGLGLSVENEDVLVRDRPPDSRPLPAGIAVRVLGTDRDWRDAVHLDLAQEGPGRADPDAFARFVQARWTARRALARTGAAAFLGAYRGAEQVAQLGIVLCADHARFQSVLTAGHERGRGLAGHLLGVAGAWAEQAGAARWRILVEPGSAAARLYRSVGFRYADTSWQVAGS